MIEDDNAEKIKEQAQRYYTEMKSFEEALMKTKQIQYVCLINNHWLEKWKKYCDFIYIQNKNKHPEIYRLKPEKKFILDPRLFPGEITNKDLLIPQNTFVNTKEPEDYSTSILKPDIKLNVDFSCVSEEMWKILFEIYGGGPLIQKSIDKYNFYKATITGYSSSLKILFIPSREILSKEIINSMECYQFCFELPTSVIDIKEHIRYCLIHPNNDELRMKLIGPIPENQEVKIELYSNLRSYPIKELKKLLLSNIESIQEGNMIDIISVMSLINDSRVNTYFNRNEFILCEYYLTTSLFFNSQSQEDQTYYPESNNDYHHQHYNGFDEIQDSIMEDYSNNGNKKKNWNNNYNPGMFNNHYDLKNNVKLDPNYNRNGIVGLCNLGNTCYMNTSLQCLSNLFELSDYFLKDSFKNDLVSTNKKDNNNFINCYSDVIKALWHGNKNHFPPSQFKSTIHHLNKMFLGYNQHDMHEFICFLLDTLHEGLNRAKNIPKASSPIKPISNNNINSNNCSDSIDNVDQISKIEKNNQSIISDLIFGILKSTVLCPNESCSNISVIYEPYTTLSLPLAQDSIKTTQVTCFMIFYDLSISPIEFNIWINSSTTIDSFRIKIGDLFKIRRDSFLITKLENDFQEINPQTTLTIEEFLSNSGKPLFLLQISPEVFGESFETLSHLKNIYNEIKSNDELLNIASRQENDNSDINQNKYDPMKNIDNKKWIKGVFYQYGYSIPKKEHEKGDMPNSRLIFPRIIFINKDWTFVHLYNLLIDYFSLFYTQPKEILFKDIETHLTKSVSNKKSKEKRKPIPLPFIMLYEDIRDRKSKYLCLEENFKNQTVPYDGSVSVLLNKKLPNIDDYSQHVVLFKIVWIGEYHTKVKNLNNREKLTYIPSIKKKGGLDKCIEKFIVREQLNEDNKWYCPKCKQDQLAEKIIEIVKLPTYLILHLKRFNHHMKIDAEIDFPITGLSMQHYAQLKEEEKDNCIYDLVAIGNHSGCLNGGHYYAYGKNHSDNQWYEFNDSYFQQISEKDLISSNAYVLFYKKRERITKETSN